MNPKYYAKKAAKEFVNKTNLREDLTAQEVRIIKNSYEHSFIDMHHYLKQKLTPHRLRIYKIKPGMSGAIAKDVHKVNY